MWPVHTVLLLTRVALYFVGNDVCKLRLTSARWDGLPPVHSTSLLADVKPFAEPALIEALTTIAARRCFQQQALFSWQSCSRKTSLIFQCVCLCVCVCTCTQFVLLIHHCLSFCGQLSPPRSSHGQRWQAKTLPLQLVAPRQRLPSAPPARLNPVARRSPKLMPARPCLASRPCLLAVLSLSPSEHPGKRIISRVPQ